MSGQDWIRIAWLIAAYLASVVCVVTLREAWLDWRAVQRRGIRNGRRIVARMLARDEGLALGVQVGFIAVVVSSWLLPDAPVVRGGVFIVISLMLGVGSAWRWQDRRHFNDEYGAPREDAAPKQNGGTPHAGL